MFGMAALRDMSGRSIAAGKECGLRPNDKRLFKLAEPDASVSAFDPIRRGTDPFHGLLDGAARFCNDS
jgi:hypothetical protein